VGFAYAGGDLNSTWYDVEGYRIEANGWSSGQPFPAGYGTATRGIGSSLSLITVIE
jgi:hypothetical protein